MAEQAENEEVKSFFESMAQEEIIHLKALSAQFKAFNKGGNFEPGTFEGPQLSYEYTTGNIFQ